MFEIIKKEGRVLNLGIINCDIYGGDRVGAICGINEGIIEGCYNTGYIRGHGTVTSLGGIAGGMHNNGKISRCYNIGKIETIPTMASGNGYVGGIVGEAYYKSGGEIQDCYNAGALIGRGSAVSGGIVGWGGPVICNCYNVGSIFSQDTIGEICPDYSTVSTQNRGLYYYLIGVEDTYGNELASGRNAVK